MNIRRSLITVALLVPLVLSACSSSTEKGAPSGTSTEQPMDVSGARTAVALSVSVLRTVQPTVRPGVLLGMYAARFLADGQAVPVTAAMDGIQAQLRMHGTPTPESVDDLWSLLEEFAAVLHVDVQDLLNRSDDRATTLDAYAEGLGNITERSRRRSEDIKQQLADLKIKEKEQKSVVSALNKEMKNAITAKDFATAQSKQQELNDAQSALNSTQLSSKEMTAIQNTFKELLDIAGKRIAAIEGNRELLIAGLSAVDVPGVDDLGVIQGRERSRGGRSGTFNPFGGL